MTLSYIVSIDYTKLKAGLVTVDRHTSSFDCGAMKDNGVVGVIIEAGYLFQPNHRKVINYRNPKLYNQVEACMLSDMPFGYYTTVRANTEDEVKEEMYQFSFMIRKYPPALGAWLILDFPSGNKAKNDRFLDIYKTQLIRLGLKELIGVYVNQSQLNLINWSKHQKDWHLWIDQHVSDVSEINQLLDPTFFDMAGRYS